ncbi:unnamed protein product [Cyprideis torosa]|uniref:Uncharacterized protein n=1 Tax=Cyprideis torosa TaxID=163714 RepID=A0A7R8W2R4_9CRUS|nr:unnamed protein product [Cyprideis torosa]CAG0881329.1 unnamed protein product [Cyprideis torosa]
MELSRRSCCVQASLHDNLSRSPPRQLPSPGPLTAYALHSTSESLYQHRSSTSPLHPGHGSQGGAPFRWPEPTGPITAYATVSAEQPPPPLKRYPVIGPPRTYTRLPNISVPSYPPPVSGPTSLSFVQRHTVYYAALASTSNSSSLNCAHPWFPATPSNTYASIRPRQPITVSPVSYLAIPACAATQAAPSPPSPHFQAKNADSFPRPALPLRNHKLELQENNVESIKSSIKLKQLPRQTSTTTMAKSSSQIFYQQPPLLFKTSQNIGTFNVTDTFEPPRPQTRFPRMQLSEMDTNLNRPVNPLSPITQKFRRHVFLTETSISDFVIKRSISELDESGSNLSSETCSAVFTDFTNTMGSAGKEEIYWETTGPIPVPQRKQKVRQRRKNFGSKIDLNGIQLFKWSDTRRDLEVGTPDPPSTVSENTGVESTLPLSSRMTRMRHSSNPGKDIPALRMQEDSTAVKLLKLLVDSHSQINRTGMTSEIVKHRSHQTRHRGGEKLSYDDYAESLRRYRNRLRKQAVSVFDASGSTSTSTGTGQTWTYKPRSLPTVKRRQNLDIV